MSSFPTISDVDLKNQRVLIRVDFNVPLNNQDNTISDLTRIEKSLPTIHKALKEGSKVILMSHLGRPKGKVVNELSLKIISEALQKLMPDNEVLFTNEAIGNKTIEKANTLKSGQILLLENLRFHPEETSKEKSKREKFADILAAHGEIYIDDAFGACHRAHASIVEVAEKMNSCAGLLLQKELETLGSLMTNPKKPVVAIIGGAKVSSKLNVLEKLIPKVDTLLIGGAMAYTFLKSRLLEIGDSMVEKEYLSQAFQIIDKAAYNRTEILLPQDHIASNEFSEKGKIKTCGKEIPDGFMGMDIGPKTIELYIKHIKKAQTVFWNGPMGVFEMPAFSKGTIKIAKAVAKVKGNTIIGGGDSVYAARIAKVEDSINHISTGGGATLEFLEGKKLPGVEALQK